MMSRLTICLALTWFLAACGDSDPGTSPDGRVPDAASSDAAARDAPEADASGSPDAPEADAAASPDAAETDAAAPDAAPVDASPPDAVGADGGPAGRLVIHAGEMRMPADATYCVSSPCPMYLSICSGTTCALADFAACQRSFFCSYGPPDCGGTVSGLADGTYTVAAFVDIDRDAVPGAPLPDSGDAVPAACGVATITGGDPSPLPLNLVIRNFVP